MTVTSELGQVLRDHDGMRLEFVRTYHEPVEEVWSALTEPERLARWIGRWSGDPATGRVEFVMAEDEGSTPQNVTILDCRPPTRLVVDLPSPDGMWRLSANLRVDGTVTTLTFTHRLAEPYDASSVGPGWHFYLDRLGAVVTGLPVPGKWEAYYPVLKDDYPLPRG